MIASAVIGWILVILGVLMFLMSLVERAIKIVAALKQGRFTPVEGDVRGVKDTLDALTRLLEAFSKFSEEIQRLLLGAGLIALGIYLLQTRPF